MLVVKLKASRAFANMITGLKSGYGQEIPESQIADQPTEA